MKYKSIQQIWDQFSDIYEAWIASGSKSWWIVERAESVTRRYVDNIIDATVGYNGDVDAVKDTPYPSTVYAKL